MESLDPSTSPCTLHLYHSPRIYRTVQHHVIPQAWTRQLGQPDSPRVTICDTAHYAIHSWIDVAIDPQGVFPRHFPRAYRDIATEAIRWWQDNNRPPVHHTSLENLNG